MADENLSFVICHFSFKYLGILFVRGQEPAGRCCCFNRRRLHGHWSQRVLGASVCFLGSSLPNAQRLKIFSA